MGQLQQKVEQKGVRFTVVGTETLGFDEFVSLNFVAPKDAFVDEQAKLHQAFARPLTMSEVARSLLTVSMWSRLWNSTIKGNMVVGKSQYYMDGMLVLAGDEGKVYYSQTLNMLADEFDFDAIMKSVDRSVEDLNNKE
eukprot:TRINITY_DN2928_c0_g1_i1.p1 TRINITY_DN2928_c0_g1~~TRINITY_DN2928_c0_g1_i1.p1  ORF type:complete len:138 (-),score=25.09 TRINITY_DN2928_c0_g1_i1:229-642(-)